jgi:hypothetical protein
MNDVAAILLGCLVAATLTEAVAELKVPDAKLRVMGE